jgi:acetyl-CoA carboxylase beta subunit
MLRMDYTKPRQRRCPDCGEYRPARDYLNRNGDDTETCKSCRSVNKLIAAHERAEIILDEGAHERE